MFNQETGRKHIYYNGLLLSIDTWDLDSSNTSLRVIYTKSPLLAEFDRRMCEGLKNNKTVCVKDGTFETIDIDLPKLNCKIFSKTYIPIDTYIVFIAVS